MQHTYGVGQHSLNMITSCKEVVNLNYVATCVALTLSKQLLCNWRTTLMHTIMPRVWLGKGP
jgi:hypothetical protein